MSFRQQSWQSQSCNRQSRLLEWRSQPLLALAQLALPLILALAQLAPLVIPQQMFPLVEFLESLALGFVPTLVELALQQLALPQ